MNEFLPWKWHYLTPFHSEWSWAPGLMTALSIALIHQRAHELEKGQTCLREEWVWQNVSILNLWSQLNRKRNSCIYPRSLEAAIHSSSSGSRVECFPPDGFLVQVSPMWANICSSEGSLSKTLHPYQLHGWMLLFSMSNSVQRDQYDINIIHKGFIQVHVPAVAFALSKHDWGYASVTRGIGLSRGYQMQLLSVGSGSLISIRTSHYSTVFLNFLLRAKCRQYVHNTWKHLVNSE